MALRSSSGRVVRLLAACILGSAGVVVAGQPAQAAGTWGQAVEVPGTATLNAGGDARVASISCPSAGNCSAAGGYIDAAGHRQVFVVTRVSGAWGTAAQLPGLAALNAGDALVYAISCPTAGNCGAGGSYTDGSAHRQAFVVNEVNGTWGSARKVPGTAALNVGGIAWLNAISCASAGNCSAGGTYWDGPTHAQAFVVSQVNGVWRTAKQVPGFAALNPGGNGHVMSLSCPSAGNCSAGGQYKDGAGHVQAYVVDQVGGTWRTAKEVPGAGTLNAGGNANVFSLSCASAGNCSAGGGYTTAVGNEAFVVDRVNGTWRTAKKVPGTGSLNAGGLALILSVSCASAGRCSAGGWYYDSSRHGHAMVVNRVNGAWANASEVPGSATLDAGRGAGINSVSCRSPGNCSAGGFYRDGAGRTQALVASQVNGTWNDALELPGSEVLNAGGSASVTSVSCASPGNCSAGGEYTDGSGHAQALVADQQ